MTVYKAKDMFEAGTLIAFLKAHEVNAQSFDNHINVMHFGAQLFAPIRILVNEKDRAHAEKTIKAYFKLIQEENLADT